MDITVREARSRVDGLNVIYDNMIKIQECCLRNDNAAESIEKLEEEANLSTTLRNLASTTARYIKDEMQRIEKIIDDTIVQLD